MLQYVPDMQTETGYLFDCLRWLTGAPDAELYLLIRRCGSPHAMLLAELFTTYADYTPPLERNRPKSVGCCSVM